MKHKFLLFLLTLVFSAAVDGGNDSVYAESYKGVISANSARVNSLKKTERSNRTIGEVLAADSVQIKSIGENSLAAKQKALSIAARRAFSSLLDQYAAEFVEIDDNVDSDIKEEVLPPLSSFSDREINNCVYDYSIDNEKYSESVYICEVRYRFDCKKIISLLQNRNLKCRLSGVNKPEGIEVAVYTRDFIRNSSKFPASDCVIKKYSAEYVVVFMKNYTKEKFAKLGLRYALLQ